jgi:Leucine-rich repeat (LRR) protein
MLDLSHNLLSGELPDVTPSVGLSFLSVASNSLSGAVPTEIGKLKKLSALNFSANELTASIPRELSHCESLTVLDLSRNQLTGEIPNEITNLKVLTTLNLSRSQMLLYEFMPSGLLSYDPNSVSQEKGRLLTERSGGSSPVGVGVVT